VSETLRVGLVGASGLAGADLLRLLLARDDIEVAYATSAQYAGRAIKQVHPHLAGRTDLRFAPREAPRSDHVDALIVAVPHGAAAADMRYHLKCADRVFDLSADHRLGEGAAYERHYGWTHPDPDLLAERAYGIAERHRDAIATARLVSGAGCIATTAILSLAPLADAGLLRDGAPVIVDAKVGSSAAGAAPSPGSHHPFRAGCIRAYAPVGHRHEAEIRQETGADIHLSAHAVEAVRGILATSHAFVPEGTTSKDVWQAFRACYRDEPFVRFVNERTGLVRLPEPRLTAGTNEFHLGFAFDEARGRLVVIGALDNLMKGTAGAAIQNLNIAFGLPETRGLNIPAVWP